MTERLSSVSACAWSAGGAAAVVAAEFVGESFVVERGADAFRVVAVAFFGAGALVGFFFVVVVVVVILETRSLHAFQDHLREFLVAEHRGNRFTERDEVAVERETQVIRQQR